MIKKHRFYRDYTCTILSFPKQNRSIVWDDDKKNYDFYEGIPKQDRIPLRGLKEPKQIRDQDYKHWKILCCILGCALGASLALTGFLLLLK
jgi:hypothetical protein